MLDSKIFRSAYSAISQGGQRQRVLFALAVCGDPDLVFLDEPTVGLDVEARRLLWEQIRKLIARGKTVLLTTHYLEEADALADRIVVINRGDLSLKVLHQKSRLVLRAAKFAASVAYAAKRGSMNIAGVLEAKLDRD